MKPGTAHRTVQRLRGEGPPKPGSGKGKGSSSTSDAPTRGDIHYRFTIDVPEELSEEQRKAVEALSKTMNGDPRARLFEQASRPALKAPPAAGSGSRSGAGDGSGSGAKGSA